MKKYLAVILATVGVVCLLAVPQPAASIEYGGIGARPAYPRADNPRTQDIFVYTLGSGAAQDDGVTVINNTQEAKTIYLYSADSTPSTDGGFACKQYLESTRKVSTDKHGVGSWITFSIVPPDRLKIDPGLPTEADTDGDGLADREEVSLGLDPTEADTDGDGYGDAVEVRQGHDPLQPVTVRLEAMSNAVVPFTIRVPQDADVGGQDGCILVQEKPRQQDASAEGIAIATRTGLRVSVTVPGEINRQLEIIGMTAARQANGSAVIHPAVRNVGNVSVDADVSVIVKNVFGRIMGEYGGKYSILRNATSEWNFELPAQFWGGWHRASLTVAYDHDPTLELGKAGTDHVSLSGSAATFFMMPSLYAILIYSAALLLVILLLLAWWWSHRRKRWIQRTWVAYTVQPGDTVKTLVSRHRVSWKLLVRVNHLKAPFDLNTGQTIKVPPPIS